KGDNFYYVKKDGVYKKKMNGGNEKVIYNKAVEPTKSYLYLVAGDMYLYTDNGTIMNLDTKKSNEVKDKKLADDVMLQKVWNAQKELTNVQMAALTGNPKRVGDFLYGELVNPIYNKKDNLETTLSTYFSKSFMAEYMKSKYIKELNGKMHYVIGDPGSKAATKFTKIISAELKDGKIKAQVETYNDYDNVTETVEVEFIYEHNQWVINNMPRFGLS
ncbi:DL-endopeptidase inhibitor IseA family protein, partial [Vibrio parahaemolyticus]|nr:DL-endopeptidase inhibitor IseA family protein [Vibrio parahaemolyticus]